MGKPKKPERFSKLIDEALAAAENLWRPQVCWELFTVSEREQNGVVHLHDTVGNTTGTLHIGTRANLLDPALECFAAVTTIGGELSEKTREFEAAGDLLRAYILDIIGTLALDETHKAFRQTVESYVISKNWGVGPVMQPGSLEGWAIEDQDCLVKLLPIESIGVTLNAQYIMIPFKSTSCLVGVGPGYETMGVECLCEDCPRLDCIWRRGRDYE